MQGPVNASERAIMPIAGGTGDSLAKHPRFPLSVANFGMADNTLGTPKRQFRDKGVARQVDHL